jgi:hypothetical protein
MATAKDKIPSTAVRTFATAYRLTWIGCAGPNLCLKDCGRYFATLQEAQQAANEFNAMRLVRSQRPCAFILHFQYEPLRSPFNPKIKILSLFLLDGTEIVGARPSTDA